MTDDRKIRVVGDDNDGKLREQAETIAEETDAQHVSIAPVTESNKGVVLPAAQTEATVDLQELKDLGEFLDSLRTIVLGHEQRLGYIEAFLAQIFPGDEDEVDGEAVPSESEEDAEEVSEPDSPANSGYSPDNGGSPIPREDS